MRATGNPLEGRFAGELILASTSPRRIDLLNQAGYQFAVVPPGVEESQAQHLTPKELSLLNARRKAHAISLFSPKAVVIAADTVVAIDGKTLGKPADLDEAQKMIELLNGRTHQVVTGVCLMCRENNQTVVFSETSNVTFQSLNNEQIGNYLSKINPLDKAGGYAAQEYKEEIIHEIDGSLSNVVGLPMEALAMMLSKFF